MKILSLGTYPIIECLHGGQIRTKHFIDRYKKILGDNNAKYIAIYNPHAYPIASKNDIAVGKATIQRITSTNYAEDIICGEAIWYDDRVKKQMVEIITKFKPEVIECVQGYSYFGVKKIVKELGVNVKILYNAHNIEHTMKKDIYESMGLNNDSQAQKYLGKIKKNEEEIVQVSALTFAVSESDADKLLEMGSREVKIVPNAVSNISVNNDKVINWKNRFIEDRVNKSILFIGSAHLPNINGFEKLVADKPGFIDLHTKIYVVGSVCDLLKTKHATDSLIDIVFMDRIKLLGKLPEEDLRALIYISDVALLPILDGGGSNLKTAEAIYYANKIVATDVAMRSFGDFINFPNIKIANNPIDFKKAILSQLQASKTNLTQTQIDQKSTLTWLYALKSVDNNLLERVN